MNELYLDIWKKAVPLLKVAEIHNPLFHYCSLETFFSIVEKHSLRLTNGYLMNDYKEQMYFYELCEQWYNDNINILTTKQKDAIKLYFAFSKINSCPFYCLCFCEDGNLLSQWRAYGDNGQGVSIGFDLKALGYENGYPAINIDHPSILAFPIEYELEKQKEIVKKIMSLVIENAEITDIGSLVADIGAFLAISFKHNGFSEEKEWRIAFRLPRFGSIVWDKAPDIDLGKFKIEYAVKDKQLISYHDEIIDPCFTEKTMPKIIVGPKATVNEEILHMFLEQYRINPSICSYSKIPYR